LRAPSDAPQRLDGETLRSIARSYNVSPQTISRIFQGVRVKCIVTF
jgi:hypothetical protein